MDCHLFSPIKGSHKFSVSKGRLYRSVNKYGGIEQFPITFCKEAAVNSFVFFRFPGRLLGPAAVYSQSNLQAVGPT